MNYVVNKCLIHIHQNNRGLILKPNHSKQHSNSNRSTRDDPRKLTVLHQNIRGLNNMKLLDFNVELKHYQYPDILCLSETWFSTDSAKYLVPEQYKLATMFCRINKSHGGCAIYVLEKITYSVIDVSIFCSESIFECCGIETVDNNSERLVVFTVYRTPDSVAALFLAKFESLLLFISKKFNSNTRILIAGDFNINILKPSRTQSDFLTCAQSYGYAHLITEATRSTITSSSCIDQIFANSLIHIDQVKIFDSDLSDHTLQMVTINFNRKKCPTTKTVTRKNFNIIDHQKKFLNRLSKETWFDTFKSTSADEKFSFFTSKLQHHVDMSFPNTTLSKNRIKNTWITKGILTSRKHKIQLYRQIKHDSNSNLNNYYKKYLHIYKKVIKAAKLLSFKTSLRD